MLQLHPQVGRIKRFYGVLSYKMYTLRAPDLSQAGQLGLPEPHPARGGEGRVGGPRRSDEDERGAWELALKHKNTHREQFSLHLSLKGIWGMSRSLRTRC